MTDKVRAAIALAALVLLLPALPAGALTPSAQGPLEADPGSDSEVLLNTRQLDVDLDGTITSITHDVRRDRLAVLVTSDSGSELVILGPERSIIREVAVADSATVTYDRDNDNYILAQADGSRTATVDAGSLRVGSSPTTTVDPLAYDAASDSEITWDEGGLTNATTGEEIGPDISLDSTTQAVAVEPESGNLIVIEDGAESLSVFTADGEREAEWSVGDSLTPTGVVVAGTADQTDEPEDLTLVVLAESTTTGETMLFEAVASSQTAAASSALVTTPASFATSGWSPPSPDPSGISFDDSETNLWIVDSEVNETALWTGINVFEATPGGSLVGTSAATGFSNEPTGITVDPTDGTTYLTDDNSDQVFVVDTGADGRIGGGDDTVQSFDTDAFGSGDPEGITLARDLDALFIVDASNREVYRINSGANGVFEGLGGGSDDTFSNWDTAALGLNDPEGIAYIAETSSLIIVSETVAVETSIDGTLLRSIDTSAFNPVQLSGVVASSYDDSAGGWHILMADRAVDNNDDPDENDGRVHAFVLSPTNTAPAAVDDATSVSIGGQVDIAVLDNDTDADGNIDPASVAIDCVGCASPSFGQVTANPDGTVSYVSTQGGSATDTFDYEVCDTGFDGDPSTDENDLCDTASVTVTLVGSNPPVAADDNFATTEDVAASFDVVANDSDTDGDLDPASLNLDCVGCTDPTIGSASVNGTEIDYVPNPDANGSDSFVYEICDTTGLCDQATVSVSVTPVADPPQAVDDVASTGINTAVTISVVDNDVDPDDDLDPSTVTTSCGGCAVPANGSVSAATDGTVTYTPTAGFVGSDQFGYQVCDSTAVCSSATVTVSVVGHQSITFSTIGDVPYSTSEIPELQAHLDNHNLYSPSEFFVHLGDIKSGSAPCVESWYQGVAGQLGGLAVPTFVVPGDNEWADCADPAVGWQYWMDNFFQIEDRFCAPPSVSRQSVRPENFSFVEDGVLFIGINLIRGFVAEGEEPARLQDNADWVSDRLSTLGPSVRAAVIFAQAAPFTNPFSDQFESAATDFGKPVLYLMGDGHFWIDDRPYPSTQNIRRIQVERGFAGNPPIEVTVTTDPTDTFTVDRDPWPSGTSPLNRPPCVEAGPDQTDVQTAELNALATDDGVPTSGALSLAWTATGPGTVTFADPTAASTTADFSAGGTYELTLSADDGELSASDTLSVTVSGVNGAPVGVDDAATTDEDTPVTVDVLANDTDPDGDTLTVSDVTQPTNGSVTNNGGDVTYTPDPDYDGTDSFTYIASDGTLESDPTTVTVTVSATNDAPVVLDDNATTDENSPVTVDVLANDTDPDGDTLTVDSVTQPTNGSVTNNGTDVTYTPDANYSGSDTFTYTATDGTDTQTATVTITINDVNGAPVGTDDTATTDENTPVTVDVLANDTDPDGDTLTVSDVTQPTNGTVTNNGTDVTYTPDTGFSGADSFTYTATDGVLNTGPVTVTIAVNDVNGTPVGTDDTATTDEDTPVTIDVLANDTDPDSDPLTVSGVTQPTNGSVTNNGTDVTYTPEPDYNGADSFTYTATDGVLDTGPVTVTVTVTPINDDPVAVDDAATTDKNTPVTVDVLANDTDPDGDPLSVDSVTQPTNGTVTNNGTDVTYTPDPNYNGADSFTYTATDGTTTQTATVTITVNDVNGTPVGTDDTATTDEDTPVTIDVLANDTDPDSDPLTVSDVTQPTNGSVTNNGTDVTYTPDPDYNGADSFTYTATDGVLDTGPITVTVTVTAVNDDPVAVDDAATTDENTPVTVDVLANDTDPDGDPLAVDSVTQPTNGTVTNNGTDVTYTPDTGFNGADSFTYTATDGTTTQTATVTITVNDVNGTPVGTDDTATTDEDTAVTIDVLANDTDPDSDPLTVSDVTQPTNGAVTNNGGDVTYTPDPDYNGADSFTYTATDGVLNTGSITVAVTVTAVNDDPVAVDDAATTDENTPVTVDVLANDTDPDGDPLAVDSVTQPTNGTVTNNGTDVTYTPDPNYNGGDSFTYTATDGTTTQTATVTITVNDVNGTPVGTDDTATTDEDTPVDVDVLANDTDPDSDPLSVDSVTQPTNGAVTNNGGDVTYTPDPDYNGTDTFTYTATDGVLNTGPVTVTVTVTPINDDPVAVDDAATTDENTPVTVDVLANDTDPDGDPLSVDSVTQPTNGTVTNNGTDVTYTPDNNYTGTDTFTYTATDGTTTQTATVTITVELDTGVIQVVESETTLNGNVTSGDYNRTVIEDGVSEELTESTTGGRPSSRVSRLDHRWTIDVLSGSDVTLSVVAQSQSTTEQFELSYSDDGGVSFDTFLDPVVIDDASPSLITRSLDPSISGEVVLRMVDLDRTPGSDPADSIEIDYLAITTLGAQEELPRVSVSAAPTVSEGDPSVVFSLSRDGDTSGPLSATISLDGDATPGSDYLAPPLTVEFAADESTTDVVVSLIDDGLVEPNESLVVTVEDGADYMAGSPSSATVSILDDDGSSLTIVATAESAGFGTVTGTYVATQASDDVLQAVTESGYGGTRSRLEHEWIFEVGSCSNPTITVEARHNATAETFDFSWADDVTSFTDFWTMPGGAAENSTTTSVASLSGTVTVRVNDSDQSRREPSLNTVWIDHMEITCG